MATRTTTTLAHGARCWWRLLCSNPGPTGCQVDSWNSAYRGMCLCTVCWRLRGTRVPDLRQNPPSPDQLLFVTREDRSRLAHRDLGCRWLGNGGFDAIKVCRRCWTWLTEENRRRVEAIQRDGGGQELHSHMFITSHSCVIVSHISFADLQMSTSSTAQGGGGSFKNRKLIGEFGCCGSRMAERSHWWTDRWLRSPLFLLSFSLSLFLSFSLSFFLSFSDYLPIYLSISLSSYLAI